MSESTPPASISISSRARVPLVDYEHVLLGHGSGGTLTADLIQRVFLEGYGSEPAAGSGGPGDAHAEQRRAATGTRPRGSRLTTDSFVVRPPFFPGGDIGRLAVHGTVNDLAVGGATPLYLAAAFILEEGLPMADLRRIVASMREACAEAGVSIVTGDTKVVDRGKGDQIFITTTGVGIVPEGRCLSVRNARPGDKVLVSGTIGDHGIAILSVREGIEFETVLESDSAAAARFDAGHARGVSVDPLDARPDPRRAVEFAQRTGRRFARRRKN